MVEPSILNVVIKIKHFVKINLLLTITYRILSIDHICNVLPEVGENNYCVMHGRGMADTTT